MVRLQVMVVVALLAAACSGSSSPTGPSSTATLPPLDVMLADKVMGNAAAPVTMLEYSSLTCPHCADFHANTLPQIKTSYIDPGRVKLISRDFPLDNSALSAAMVARCSGDNYFSVLDLLYKGQGSWAGASDLAAALKRTVAPSGMSGADVDACLASTDLRNGIMNIRTGGQNEFGVNGTPTFIINGQKVVGAQPYATFDAILRSLLP
jgi:protein-disulfide isomerase